MKYSVVLALTYIASSSMIIIFPRIAHEIAILGMHPHIHTHQGDKRGQKPGNTNDVPCYLLVKSWLRICTPDQCECGSIDPKPQVLKHDRHEGL